MKTFGLIWYGVGMWAVDSLARIAVDQKAVLQNTGPASQPDA